MEKSCAVMAGKVRERCIADNEIKFAPAPCCARGRLESFRHRLA